MDDNNLNKSKWDKFLVGFLVLLVPYVIIFIAGDMGRGYGPLNAIFVGFFFFVGGCILCLVMEHFKMKKLALGLLLGGLSPVLVIFILTGGCGLFYR